MPRNIYYFAKHKKTYLSRIRIRSFWGHPDPGPDLNLFKPDPWIRIQKNGPDPKKWTGSATLFNMTKQVWKVHTY